MRNRQQEIQDAGLEYYCQAGANLLKAPESRNIAITDLAPKDTNNKPNFTLLMWRIAYLLRNLEKTEVEGKEEKRKQLGLLALYLYNIKKIHPEQCSYFGKTAADLLVKANNINSNSLYKYLAPSKLLPTASWQSRLAWLNPIPKKERNLKGFIWNVLAPGASIGLITAIGAAFLSTIGLGIVAAVMLPVIIGGVFLRACYKENEEKEHKNTVAPIIDDIKKNYPQVNIGDCNITARQRNGITATESVISDNKGRNDNSRTNDSRSVTELDIVNEYELNKEENKKHIKVDGQEALWKNYTAAAKVGLQSKFWRVDNNASNENYDLETAYQEYKRPGIK